MSNVAVAFNKKVVEASDAARELGCAYSTIVALLAKKKLKGQKVNRRWFVDFEDLQKAKSTHMIKTRMSKLKRQRMMMNADRLKPVVEEPKANGKTEVRFYVDKDKFNVLQMALQSVDRNLTDYVDEKVNDLYNKVKESLKNLRV